MKKLILLSMITLLSTACSANSDDFSGEFKRINASKFEQEQKMNTSLSIIKNENNDNYLVVFHSGYGDISYPATLNNNELIVGNEIFIITKNKKKLEVVYDRDQVVPFQYTPE